MSISIIQSIEGWGHKDLANFCSILKIDQSSTSQLIEDRIKWLYHSKTRAFMKKTAGDMGGKLKEKLFKFNTPDFLNIQEIYEVPSYNLLVIEACKFMKVFEKEVSLSDHETFLSQAIIVDALKYMKPRERQTFFEQQIEVPEIVREARIKGVSLAKPVTTFGLLGLAQVSGFGVYAASTTALGFVTHAIGATLPFAAYTGLTSSIAVLIGPVGWLTAGLWGAWKITEPSWKILIPAIVYIISTNSRMDLL